jgi:hypothetical protein
MGNLLIDTCPALVVIGDERGAFFCAFVDSTPEEILA